MISVERPKTNTLQTEVIRLDAENLQLSQNEDLSKEDVVSCKLAAINFGIILSPHSKREMTDISQQLGWMQMEEHQPESVADGRVGTDDTTLIERVKPSSFVAAGDLLPVHLNSQTNSMSWRYPDSRTKVLMFLWRSHNKWRETQLPGQRNLKNLSSEPWPGFRNFKIWRMTFKSEVSSCASRPIEAMVWINEIESAKSIVDPQTSYSITRDK